jgi:hypothetical protein
MLHKQYELGAPYIIAHIRDYIFQTGQYIYHQVLGLTQGYEVGSRRKNYDGLKDQSTFVAALLVRRLRLNGANILFVASGQSAL